MEQLLEIDTDFLLRVVLAWYASPANWSNATAQGPYSSTKSSPASVDGGKKASRAVWSKGVGPLILLVMDTIGQPLNELSRVSGIEVPRLSLIIQGADPTHDESVSLRAGISVLAHLNSIAPQV